MSKVYMVDLHSTGKSNNKLNKLKKLFNKVGYNGLINPNDLTAIKIHFGEDGKDTFIRPIFTKPIVELVRKAGGIPFLTDTNTLYSGPRNLGPTHIEVAHSHGFLPQVTGAPVVIADGINGKDYREVTVNLKHFEKCYIASGILDADKMVVLTHFKGHEMAGFGGSIKNLGMGCAPPIGKGKQHSTKQTVNPKKCIGCRKCFNVCAHNAIEMINGKALISPEKCVGCGECMTVCESDAIFLNWETELSEFNERLVEYAYASVKDKDVLYINFVLDITPNCDCVPWSDETLVHDIGILASTDPVAIDQASLDLVNKASNNPLDIFKSVHPHTVGNIQLSYGEEVGLGSRDYELILI
jgi:uncharacterized Fe-S center protein